MGIFDVFRKKAAPPPAGDVPPSRLAAPPADGLPAPLSDVMARVLADPTPEHWRAFHAAFLRSRLGVVASGIPPEAGGAYRVAAGDHVGLARAATPDGRVMLLACADRETFIQRFHARFNAEMLGRELAVTALANPDCQGILVNSAASFESLAIDRAQLAALLADA